MAKQKKQPKEVIDEKIDELMGTAYRCGIAGGLAVATRIANWYGENHKLENPHSQETLKEWTENSLKELQKLMDMVPGK